MTNQNMEDVHNYVQVWLPGTEIGRGYGILSPRLSDHLLSIIKKHPES